jgi:hypothetical protein
MISPQVVRVGSNGHIRRPDADELPADSLKGVGSPPVGTITSASDVTDSRIENSKPDRSGGSESRRANSTDASVR